MTLPQMALRLGVGRDTVYSIIKSKQGKALLNTLTVGDKQYVELESFMRWLASQDRYALHEGSPRRRLKPSEKKPGILLRKPMNPAYYTVEEVTRFYGIKQSALYAKLKSGAIPAIRTGSLWRIKRDEFDKMLMERSKDRWQASTSATESLL